MWTRIHQIKITTTPENWANNFQTSKFGRKNIRQGRKAYAIKNFGYLDWVSQNQRQILYINPFSFDFWPHIGVLVSNTKTQFGRFRCLGHLSIVPTPTRIWHQWKRSLEIFTLGKTNQKYCKDVPDHKNTKISI